MEYEEKRHIELLEKGENSLKETRRWDEQNQVTISMRSKENVQDYRYFPEADIVDFVISEEYINAVKDSLPELPSEKRKRFIKEYGVTHDDASILNSSKEISAYFEKLIALTEDKQVTTNFFLSEFLRRLKDSDSTIGNEKFDINQFAFLLNQISQKKINNNMAKKIFRKMFEDGIDPKDHIEKEGLTQVQDEGFILDIVKEVLSQNPQSIDDLKNGKDRAFGFLVGQVMKQSKGKANPQIVNTLLKKEIESM
jgi:aspartyl/glutamyl-tRNA(asn/gln) amidotransferase subunit B